MVLLCALFLTASGTACESDASSETDGGPQRLSAVEINPTDRAELADGGTLRWGINEFPSQWNFHHANGGLSTVSTVLTSLMPRPFRVDGSGEAHPDPDYVRDVTVEFSPRQTVTLRLNPQARWSDGTPITWRDYAGMVYALSGESSGYQVGSSIGYDRIADVSAGADDYEVVITFDRPFTEYRSLFHLLLPADYTDSPERFNTGYLDRIPITAGPFTVEAIDRTAQTLTLVRDPDWWGEPAKLDRIIFRSLGAEALASAFLDGGIDVYTLPPDPASLERVSDARDGEIRAALAPDYRHITLNGQSPALSDVDVRHAVFLAIDRTALAESAFGSLAWQPDQPLGNHFLLPVQEGYRDNSGQWGKHDPERAMELLERAGWSGGPDEGRTKDGQRLSLRYIVPRGYAPARNEAQLVQSMLGQVGVEVVIEEVSGDELFSSYVVPGDYDLVSFVTTGDGFPVSGGMEQWANAVTVDGERRWRGNVGRIGSPEIDAAMSKALTTTDRDVAIQHINEADRLLWEAGHTLPLYQRPEFTAVRSDLANIGAAGFAILDYADIGFLKP
ncbi:ABC transporter family substrate-binding protein [Salinactinospora qingdaonensis]|uniref:ABC transporter family substrate-binding protein n=1 Tax=Salinactinospora qingdaonensis TaxID=702744 RepID=A0ABP7G6G6_9ACTN